MSLRLCAHKIRLNPTPEQEIYFRKAAGTKRFVYASSKTCNDCGYINKELTLSERTWTCQGCGTIHDRDWNAAKNIEQEALRLACGSTELAEVG